MKKFLSILSLTAILFTACKKDETTIPETEGKATVTFDAVVGTADFVLDQNFTVGTKTWNFTQFRYWVSNVTLVKASGEEYKIPNSFYLIEENKATGSDNTDFIYPANKRESIQLSNIPAGDYKGIKFSVGVEEKYNNNLSLQAGELSQLNGMTNVSWMWATSYIFSSVKGKVTEGATNKNIVVETGLNANYKSVSLSFPANLRIGSSKSTTILLNADVSKATDGIDIMATPTVGASQATVMTAVANNYSTKVFSVKSVN